MQEKALFHKLLYKNQEWPARYTDGLTGESVKAGLLNNDRRRNCNTMTATRLTFWFINQVWIFYLLAAVAITVFSAGIYSHLAVWRNAVRLRPLQLNRAHARGLVSGKKDHGSRWLEPRAFARLGHTVLDILTGRRIFKGDPAAGLMHGCILWGFSALFIGTLLVAVDHWVIQFLKGKLYLVVEFVLDAAGLLLLGGLGGALGRRYLQRIPRLESGSAAAGIPLALMLVALTGYLTEGCRLAAQDPVWGSWSFMGWRLNFLWSDEQGARAIYPFLWWLHALISLGMISYLPFSRLFSSPGRTGERLFSG